MQRLFLVSIVVASAALAACAAPNDADTPVAHAPKEYRTGSNIPVKDPTPAATPEEREQQLDQLRKVQQMGSPTAGRTGG